MARYRDEEGEETPVEPHAATAEATVAALHSAPSTGLTEGEARARLTRYGPNELRSTPPEPRWKRFLFQFRDPLVLLLLAAIAISLGVWALEGAAGVPFEAVAIAAIVALNAVLGYTQEERAEQAVAALRRLTTTQVTVVRDGTQRKIPSTELVPGDIVLIEEGDAISADARLLEVTALQVAEASLTGESEPVIKDVDPVRQDTELGDRTNMVFSGTVATFGRARALVTSTGMNTEIGHIAGLIERVPAQPTPLQVELARVGRILGIAVVAIAAAVIGTILVTGNVTSSEALVDVLLLGVSLAVAAVPEGLATVLTLVLALGVQRMAKRNALVKKLAAVETLGSASVICSDKTGTLTRNQMTVRAILTASGRVDLTGIGYEPVGEMLNEGTALDEGALKVEVRRALGAATLANNAVLEQRDGAWGILGDPTEGALLVAARKTGIEPGAVESRFGRVGEVPFSSERKLMSTVHTDAARPDEFDVFAKGAPDVLLARCDREQVGDKIEPLDDRRRKDILAGVEAVASEALRTLGVAYRPLAKESYAQPTEDIERDLVFLGVVGIIDPPRPEAKLAVAEARNAGVRPIMITGDHPGTAAAIAGELGITEPGAAVYTGRELDAMDDDDMLDAVREVSVFARVSPEHKLRIVGALQNDGDVAAMTGDGVNDAPALKMADIGVAMGINGTEVSKEAADMILLDDNFATIVGAVEEGRSIFANIRKFIRYLLSSNVGEVMTVFFGVVFAGVIGLRPQGNEIVAPLLATQILWINLLTDAAPALALGVDPLDPRLMHQPPRARSARVIDAPMWLGILMVGAAMATATLLTLDAGLSGGLIEGDGGLPRARTMAFTVLVFAQLYNVFNSRSDDVSARHRLFVNPYLWGAIALSAALQVVVVHLPLLNRAFGTVPLSGGEWLFCSAVASLVLWVDEFKKLIAGFVTRHR
jgi:P-type Ca2+ transporter type 2C